MRPRLVHLAVALVLAVAAGCGPAGPNETKGPAADPVALLHELPVPAGMRDDRPEAPAAAAEVLAATLERPPTAEEATRAQGAGLGAAATRRFANARGGTVTAIAVVWPSNLTAENFALQLVQRRLGKDGRTAWTPREVPASQGTRSEAGEREKILVRAIGPNALVVRSAGDVPDAAVARTLELLVAAQDAKG